MNAKPKNTNKWCKYAKVRNGKRVLYAHCVLLWNIIFSFLFCAIHFSYRLWVLWGWVSLFLLSAYVLRSIECCKLPWMALIIDCPYVDIVTIFIMFEPLPLTWVTWNAYMHTYNIQLRCSCRLKMFVSQRTSDIW